MKKIKVKYLIIIIAFTLGISACRDPEPTLYEGQANVFARDGEINDTLKICYCWQTKDSLNLLITSGPFSGISIDVTGENNIYRTSLEYYSDTNEFDGQFNLSVPISSDSLTITFENIKDSVRISGYFQIYSEPVKFYDDGRTVETAGTFECTMAKK